MADICIDWLGGNCPVQAEGTINGEPFYFRARGEHWSLEINDADGKIVWEYDEHYPHGQYSAGWMTEDEAKAFIELAANKYTTPSEDDGQPDAANVSEPPRLSLGRRYRHCKTGAD